MCINLVNKSIAEIISVNKSLCVYLSIIWTNCIINQKVLISKLTLFIHWCLYKQDRNSVIRSNSSLNITECRYYLFFNFNISDWIELKKICLSCIYTESLTVQIMILYSLTLQYKYRLFYIQWVFSVTDNDSQI